MAKKNKLIKSKTLYTVKNKHSVTNDGVIFENDLVTIIPNDGIYDEDMALFSNSNFKYRIDTTKHNKKRHNRGNYIQPSDTESAWTLSTISGYTTESEESKIVLKPNYSSLKDFAYYGSAVELIRATINYVILNFPGGLYYYGSKAPQVKVNGTTYYLISNEFDIDCWTGGGTIASGDVKNPMRVLAASHMNYTVGTGTTECSSPKFTSGDTCPNSIIGTVSFGAGDFSVYMDGNGKKYLVSASPGTAGDTIIKPKQEFVDKFWANIDDFAKVLLNRESTPLYKATFETPYSTDTGFYYENKNYIWPTIGNTDVPDITTGAFQGYLESLISLASFHDEYDSDNLWRMMTHESIKNMDWTFTSRKGDNEEDLSDFDTTGIGAMLRIQGRQYDDIKRYADNIKNTNSITYDGKSNVPDYFLTDVIENNGWDAQHTLPQNIIGQDLLANDISISGASGATSIIYKGGKTISDINSIFQRRLALSSSYINSMKGTRRGLEAILGMFGYVSGSDYTISEYIVTAEKELSYDDGVQLRCEFENPYEDDGFGHMMDGYAVDLVEKKEGNEEPEYVLVPWFDMKTRSKNFYFQSKGGWGKRSDKKINLPSDLTSVSSITSGDIVKIYGETQPYMKFANDIDEMLSFSHSDVFENMICYVSDISNISTAYNTEDGEPLTSGYSHYFYLKTPSLYTYCGYIKNDIYDNCGGWVNISEDEIKSGNTDIGKMVLYLESLNAKYKGNNPHIGYGKYDDGEEYLNHFRQIFKIPIDNGMVDNLKCEDPEVYDDVFAFGFTLSDYTSDDIKCQYFEDEHSDLTGGDERKYDAIINSCLIINVKKLTITFNLQKGEEQKQYIENVVLKYLEPMIPSTAIVEYKFEESKSNDTGAEGGNQGDGDKGDE